MSGKVHNNKTATYRGKPLPPSWTGTDWEITPARTALTECVVMCGGGWDSDPAFMAADEMDEFAAALIAAAAYLRGTT